MQITVDGYVAGPNGQLDWIFRGIDDDLHEFTIDALSQIDTMLMGRVTYLEQAHHWPTSTDPLAPIVNNHAKIVFSTSLASVEWTNSRLATGSAAQEIAQLNQQPGNHIGVAGGPTLAQSLLRDGLLDQLQLTIHPVVLGRGIPLFSQPLDLKLLATRTFDTGAVVHTYRPA